LGDFSSVLVVDGGSDDDTTNVARAAGAGVLTAARGRGFQLAAGAAATAAPWMLFLHADTRLEQGWRNAASGIMEDPQNLSRAAVFRFVLDSDARRARRVERFVAWRSRRLGLPYGDQGLLVHRELYDQVGGYMAVPMLEDVAIVRKIGRRRLTFLKPAAVTSAARFEQDGYLLRSMRNYLVLGLYFLGVPPKALKRLYG
jgi:rSAM/selenodomain-associated transferase 2